MRIPYVVWGRGSDVYLPDLFTKTTSKIILKNADAVLALTNGMKEIMNEICPRDIVVLPNGIIIPNQSCKEFTPPRDTGAGKKILFVGRLHPVKGLSYLIHAMSKINRIAPDAKLIIVGDGKERKALENLSEQLKNHDVIEFMGKVPHDSVSQYLHSSDIFVLPSLSEGLSNVILEAMACGLPIVATQVGGTPDIIEHGENGLLIDAMSDEQLADAVISLLKNSSLREKMSQNNLTAVERFRWENIIGELERIYNSIVHHSP